MRDQRLIESLGLPLAHYARALGVSRQAISKGIKNFDTYFSGPDLSRIVDSCRAENETLYRHAVETVRDIFTTDAERILTAAGQSTAATRLDPSLPGEFKLVSGDLMEFMSKSSHCDNQVRRIILGFEEHDGHLEVLVNRLDYKVALRYEELCPKPSTQFSRVVVDIDLSVMPTYLVRIAPDLTTTMFGCSDEGFVSISRFETERIRRTIQQLSSAALDKDH